MTESEDTGRTKSILFEMVINQLHLQSSQHISQRVIYMEFLHLSGKFL